jgi:hypothetical protein
MSSSRLGVIVAAGDVVAGDLGGLSALAGHCEAQAATVEANSAGWAPARGGGFQPSAAAVAAGHAEISVAGTRLAARLSATAAATGATTQHFGTGDRDVATRFTGIDRARITAV